MQSIDGTRPLITFSGCTVLRELLLASAGGSSLILRFDGLLGSYNRLKPLLWVDDGYSHMIGALSVGILSVIQATPDCHTREPSFGGIVKSRQAKFRQSQMEKHYRERQIDL